MSDPRKEMFRVRGLVVDQRTGRGIAGLRVEAWDNDLIGDDYVGSAETDAEGGFHIEFAPERFRELFLDRRPDLYFKVFRGGELVVSTQDLVLWRQEAGETPLAIEIAAEAPAADRPCARPSRVQGTLFFEHGLPAGGLTLRLYRKGFGSDQRLAECAVDARGGYVLPYDPGDAAPHLELRAVGADGEEIVLNDTRFHAAPVEVLHLVAPAAARPLGPEYARLAADLERELGGALGRLAEAREGDGQQDLTLLHRATGWDAGLITQAALAQRLAGETGISADALYALLRAGLPAERSALADAGADTVAAALEQADRAGIVRLDAERQATARDGYARFAREALLARTAPGAASSTAELLARSGLDPAERETFAEVLFAPDPADGSSLWERARARGLPEEKVQGLRLQGKLAYLTQNNAPLAAVLQEEVGSPDGLAALVDAGLYREDAWKERLGRLAGEGNGGVRALIPPAYAGETDEERLDAYAADLARRVRLSFPTRVVGRMLESGELALGGERARAAAPLAAMLRGAEAKGFALGRVGVDAFLREHGEAVFAGVEPADREAATAQLRRLQRLYQTTPTDGALAVLLEEGFDSALEIAAFDPDVFQERYGRRFASPDEAQLVYRKAQQVSAVVHGVATAARQLGSAPAVYALAGTPEAQAAAKQALIRDYPTLESLFGSQDYCECEHCRSVLSPAAYLVDLLQLLDPPQHVWDSFLQDWKLRHGGAEYTDRYQKPYDALVQRRPELPHLPLTCENTHTVLPYIDVVNEILEYHAAHGKLDAHGGHDTGSATTEELLAEPQNLLSAAYTTLQGAKYPLALPFDLWTETVRRFCENLEVPLWRVLEVFRATDELQPPASPAVPEPYYREDVFGEQLGLSAAERALFTDAHPLSHWYDLYGYPDAATALGALKSARTLARRLGVSYRELVELVRTAFVNPRLDALVVLRKLGVEAADVFRYYGHAGYPPFTPEETQALQTRLDELTARFQGSGFNARAWLHAAWTAGDFARVLVLAGPASGCDLGQTFLRYADGTDAEDLVFLKLNLCVRLWKKLGWTLAETDRTLQVFLPRNALPLTGATLGPALRTALVSLAHLQALAGRVRAGKDARLKLLTFWSDLPTTGKKPLYAQLFLGAGVLKSAPVFDHPLGQYLSQPGLLLQDHLQAVQGALGLTADDVERILAAAGQAPATAPLSLANLSLLHRHGVLARGLKLSVRDLLALVDLAGIDPFEPLPAAPVQALVDDHPFTRTLRFVEIAEEVRGSGLAVEDLEWMLRHRFDPVGKYRSAPGALPALVKTLGAAVRRIRAEHALPADPAALDDEQLRQKLALVLPPEGVQTFLAMWTGTLEHEAARPVAAPATPLDSARLAGHPEVRVEYDAVRQVQRLAFRGVLLDAKKAQIVLDAGYSGKGQAAQATLLTELLDEVQAGARGDFRRHLEKSTGSGRQVGFLDPADYELLFLPEPAGLTDPQREQREQDRRGTLAQAFFPFLQQQLVRQAVTQAAATDTGGDAALVEALLTETRLVEDPSIPGRPLLEALAAAGETGVSAAYFASTDGTGTPLATATAPAAAYAGAPAGAGSARFDGWFEVPAAGAYRFVVSLEQQDAEAELLVDGLERPVLRGKAAAAGAEVGGFAELKARVPYRFTLLLGSLGGGDAELQVQGETLQRGPLGQLPLYPAAAVERVGRARVLLGKVLLLVQALGLTEREVRHLLTRRADFGGVDLARLPTRAADDTPAAARARFAEFLRLTGYARLKRELTPGRDDLVSVFEAARRVHPASADPVQAMADLLAAVAGRMAEVVQAEEPAVRAAALRLGFAPSHAVKKGELWVELPALLNEQGVRRLWEVLEVARGLGVPVDAAARWATPRPDAAIARDLRDALKARRDAEAWQRVARPIFDGLRQRRRDALAAHVMHQLGFRQLEQLFEYFLVDAGMEPPVQTSRLRLALSSVQNFIQRCLLNLEKDVHPSALDAARWRWMQRYRGWEVARKIFLWPENWLEEEFRDNKTDLFRELEGALLQGDVTDQLAEDAFFGYLRKLEKVARLEMVASYLEEKPDPAANVLHVLGRTYGEPREWFYRRYKHRTWTPWEPVAAEAEGDHVALVVWRQRLHLFWVTFLEKPVEAPNAGTKVRDVADQTVSTAAPREVKLQLNWSEYFQGAWTPRASSAFMRLPPPAPPLPDGFDRSRVFITVAKEYQAGEERAVRVLLGDPLWAVFRLSSRNAQPQLFTVSPTSWHVPYFVKSFVRATLRPGMDGLWVKYDDRIHSDGSTPPTSVTRIILLNDLPDQPDPLTAGPAPRDYFSLLVNPGERPGPEVAALVSPFFYQDRLHTFFVEPTLTETTVQDWEDWVLGSGRFGGVRHAGALRLLPQVPAPRLPPPPPDPLSRFVPAGAGGEL